MNCCDYECKRLSQPYQPPELTYHPCTFILIEGLKKLKAQDVLAEWDKARQVVDKRFCAAYGDAAIRARGNT